MAHQEMKTSTQNLDRDIPMALRGDPDDLLLVRCVKTRWDQIPRHILPKNLFKSPNRFFIDRILGKNRHRKLPRKLPKPEGITPVILVARRAINHPVIIQIKSRMDSGV